MNNYDPLCYTVSAEVAIAAFQAFEYLSDPASIGRWALGCFNTLPTEHERLYRGTSLFDESETWVRVENDKKRFIIDYHIGDRQKQVPRISTRIVSGEMYGKDAGNCIVTMTAWRPVDMPAARWHRLCTTHDTEILLIKSQLERLARLSQ